MNKFESAILIIGGACLLLLILLIELSAISEGREILYLPIILPIIIAVLILNQHRSDPTVPSCLRAIGWIIFSLWIISLIIRAI